jgi:hypothetical protein
MATWRVTGATGGSPRQPDLGGDQTSVTLVMDYEPETLVEKAGDALSIIERQAQADLG